MCSNKIKIVDSPSFGDPNLIYGFTTRNGGFSSFPFESMNMALHVGDDPLKVQKNWELLADTMSFDASRITWASQVHGDNIYILSDKRKTGLVGEYDAIITNIKDIPLLAFFADCIPILLYDNKKKVIAVVHAGWKGTYLGIVKKTISKMFDFFQCNPEDISALVGPGICKKHYEIDSELAQKFIEKNTFFANEIEHKNERYYLDLKALNSHLLKEAGVERIYNIEECPFCNNLDFFSFRKEGGKTGRFAAFILLRGREISNEDK